MAKKMSAADAKNCLANVNPDNCFWLANGGSLSNLEDLKKSMKSLDDWIFSHHVNKERNDFANWIADCVGDKELARSLKRVKSKKGTLDKVSKRITQLKRLAKAKPEVAKKPKKKTKRRKKR